MYLYSFYLLFPTCLLVCLLCFISLELHKPQRGVLNLSLQHVLNLAPNVHLYEISPMSEWVSCVSLPRFSSAACIAITFYPKSCSLPTVRCTLLYCTLRSKLGIQRAVSELAWERRSCAFLCKTWLKAHSFLFCPNPATPSRAKHQLQLSNQLPSLFVSHKLCKSSTIVTRI